MNGPESFLHQGEPVAKPKPSETIAEAIEKIARIKPHVLRERKDELAKFGILPTGTTEVPKRSVETMPLRIISFNRRTSTATVPTIPPIRHHTDINKPKVVMESDGVFRVVDEE